MQTKNNKVTAKLLLTDTHTHLYSEAFDDDRAGMIQRAIDLGVERFFVPAIDSESTNAMYQLEKEYPSNVFLMAGLHPTYVKENYEVELQHVVDQLSNRSFVAIGEIGIDLYWDKTFLKQQQQAFKTQINWAKEKNADLVEGPVGFTNFDKAGLLTFGFDELSNMFTIYNAVFLYRINKQIEKNARRNSKDHDCEWSIQGKGIAA